MRTDSSSTSLNAHSITPPTSEDDKSLKSTSTKVSASAKRGSMFVGRRRSTSDATIKRSSIVGFLRRMGSRGKLAKQESMDAPVEVVPPVPSLPLLFVSGETFPFSSPSTTVVPPPSSTLDLAPSTPSSHDGHSGSSITSSSSEEDDMMRLVQAVADRYTDLDAIATPRMSDEEHSCPTTPTRASYSFLRDPTSSGPRPLRSVQSTVATKRASRLSYKFDKNVEAQVLSATRISARPVSIIRSTPSTPVLGSAPPLPSPIVTSSRPLEPDESSDEYGSDDFSDPGFWGDSPTTSAWTTPSPPKKPLIKPILLASTLSKTQRHPFPISHSRTSSSLSAAARPRALGPRAKVLLEVTNRKLFPARRNPMETDLDHPLSTNSTTALRESGELRTARVALGRMAIANKLKGGVLSLVETMELEHTCQTSTRTISISTLEAFATVDSTGADFVSRRNSKWVGPKAPMSLVGVLSAFLDPSTDMASMQAIRPPSASAVAASKMTGVPVQCVRELLSEEGMRKWMDRPSFAESHLVTLFTETEAFMDIVRPTKRASNPRSKFALPSSSPELPSTPQLGLDTPRPRREMPPTSPSTPDKASKRNSFRPLLLKTSSSRPISKAPAIPGPLFFQLDTKGVDTSPSTESHDPLSTASSDDEAVPLAVLRRQSRMTSSSPPSSVPSSPSVDATALHFANERVKALEEEIARMKKRSEAQSEHQAHLERAQAATQKRLEDERKATIEREIRSRQAEQNRRSRAMGQVGDGSLSPYRASQQMARSSSAPQLSQEHPSLSPPQFASPSPWGPGLAIPTAFPFPMWPQNPSFPMQMPMPMAMPSTMLQVPQMPQFHSPPSSPPRIRTHTPSPIHIPDYHRQSVQAPPSRPARLRPVGTSSPQPGNSRRQSTLSLKKTKRLSSSSTGMRQTPPRSASAPEPTPNGRLLTTGEAFLSTSMGKRVSRVSFVQGQ